MSNHSVTRRGFLGTAAALAAPALVPGSLLGRDQTVDTMPSPDSLRILDAYTTGVFGCSLKQLQGDTTQVLSHRVYAGDDRAIVFRHAESCIISVPASVPEIERSKLRSARPAEAFDPRFLAGTFLIRTERVLPPHWIGIADRTAFKPIRSAARALDDADQPAIQTLVERCGQLWWPHRFQSPLFGIFEGKDLIAASGPAVIGAGLACIGLVVHPSYSGKHYGNAVLSAAVAEAISKGYVAIWPTLESDPRAVALARSIGFQPYATLRHVRLAADEF